MQPELNADLSLKNTLRLPARADALGIFPSIDAFVELINWAENAGRSLRVLGSGSNVLMTSDVTGLVVQSAMTQIRPLHEDEQYTYVSVDAGVEWHQWVLESTRYGSGLENLALIPGTVGAAPVQNIGAYGVEVGDCLDSVVGYQLSTRQFRTLSASECRFGYRESVFKRELKQDFVVLRVVFRLHKVFSPVLSYGPIAEWAKQSVVTPQSLIAEICRVRASKLPDPAKIPNAGSFFKNPLVSTAIADRLQQRYPQMPQYRQADGGVKLAAGWLIEQAGWKGRWLGPVGMHKDQALVLVTDGSAAYADVELLVARVQTDVESMFEVRLEPEPQPF